MGRFSGFVDMADRSVGQSVHLRWSTVELHTHITLTWCHDPATHRSAPSTPPACGTSLLRGCERHASRHSVANAVELKGQASATNSYAIKSVCLPTSTYGSAFKGLAGQLPGRRRIDQHHHKHQVARGSLQSPYCTTPPPWQRFRRLSASVGAAEWGGAL